MLMVSSAPPSACVASGPYGDPDVLADRDADLDAADHVQLERIGVVAGREVAGLVEHGVVREQPLAVRAERPRRSRTPRRRCSRSRSASTNPTTAAHAPGAGGELAERGPVVGDEPRLQHEVLGRVAGDRQLGEGDDVAARGLGPVVRVDQLGQVAVEVADGRVELGQRDSEHGHGRDATGRAGLRLLSDVRPGRPDGGRATADDRRQGGVGHRAARRPPGAHRRRQPGGQRDRGARPGGRAGAGRVDRRRRRSSATIPGPLAGLVTAHKDLDRDRRLPDDVRLAAVRRPPSGRRLPARRPHEGGRRGRRRQDELARVRRRLAHVQPASTARRRTRGALDRSAGGSSGGAAVAAGVPDGRHRRRQRHRRLAAQPGGVEQRVGFRPSIRVVPPVGPGNAWMPLSTEGPMGRTVDDVALLFGVLGQPDDRDPMQIVVDLPAEIVPPDRPLRVAWSADLGLPIEPDAARRPRRCPRRDGRPRAGTSSTPPRTCRAPATASACCGRGTSPTARRRRSVTGVDEIKATIQRRDPARRGVQPADVATAYAGYTTAGGARPPSSTRATTCWRARSPRSPRSPSSGSTRRRSTASRWPTTSTGWRRAGGSPSPGARRCRCPPGSTPLVCPSASSSSPVRARHRPAAGRQGPRGSDRVRGPPTAGRRRA